jgi:hypothetical protein
MRLYPLPLYPVLALHTRAEAVAGTAELVHMETRGPLAREPR